MMRRKSGDLHFDALIARPDEVDPRSDLYSLGAVAYHLLTGTTVFDGETVMEVCGKHLFEAPMAPSQRTQREVPATLEALVLGSGG